MIFIISLEEKKKLWEEQKVQRTAERKRKAEAWRSELKARRMKKSLETSTEPVEITNEPKPVLSKCFKEVKKKGIVRKNRKPSSKSKDSKIKKLIKLAKGKLKIEPKKKVKEVVSKVKKKVKMLKKVVKVAKAKLKPKVKKKNIKSTKAKQEVIAVLREAVAKVKAVKEKIKPKKIMEEEPVETITGNFSDISFPKPKEKLDWSERRFKKLGNRLKKLRRL